MKTKEKILATALSLFNSKGVSSISIRDIASEVGISKGNLGYHFPRKEAIIQALYIEMNAALMGISQQFSNIESLLPQMLKAPLETYTITNQYRFLYIDYMYIIQHYPFVKETHEKQLRERIPQLIGIFDILKKQGLFRLDVSQEQCSLIMQQSTLIRAMWFVQQNLHQFASEKHKTWHYIQMVNQLLWGYLSPNGLKVYEEIMVSIHSELFEENT